MPRRRSLWRRLRRATRGPRNALLARSIWGTSRAVGRLPVPVALALGRGLGAIAHRLLARPRRLALVHVGEVFPELDTAARRRLVRATFAHAGQSFVELGLWPRLRADPGYVAIEGLEEARAAVAEGRGVIVATGHTGNWELLAAAMAAWGFPLTVVARRVRDAHFDALIVRFREEAGIEILIRDRPDFLAGVRSALARGRAVALLIDQDTLGAGVFVPFFGRPARTPAGAAVLALRSRVPVCTAFIERRASGGHLVRLARVAADDLRGRDAVTLLTARLTAAIEGQIRRAPAEWVWWHERWRRQPTSRGAGSEEVGSGGRAW